MSPYARIREKSHHKRRRKRTAESGWGSPAGHRLRSWLWLVIGLTLIGGTVAFLLRDRYRHAPASAVPLEVAADETVGDCLKAAELVARSFLAETDSEKRLQWVREPEDVRSRLMEYPDEARTGTGEIQSVVGHRVDERRPVTGFVVETPSGNLRLLEVVGTPEGLRVDWDAYARHGTANWDDLWSGKATRAVVRVFCEPATERPEPFGNQLKWTCFRISSPDMPQPALGFAAVGSVREDMMKRVVLGTPNYRQRFTLEIVRHEGKEEPLFEISRCLAVGWILDERAVEDGWMDR